MLKFLDVTKEGRPTSSNGHDPHDSIEGGSTMDTDNNGNNNSSRESHETDDTKILIESQLEIASNDEAQLEMNRRKSRTNSKNKKMTVFEEDCLINSMNSQNNVTHDPNKNFLLSLLPEMRAMNESQNFEFRLQVMNKKKLLVNLIKKN